MYLDYFKLKEMPFSLTPNINFFCGLRGHEEALNVLLFSLRSGEGFIKIVGEVGSGKTLLCRKLLDTLTDEYVTAYLPNPDLSPVELRRSLAKELDIDLINSQDQYDLLALINHRLLELHAADKRVVLLIDEAQALPLETLETLRLLTNIETEKNKLLQVVLFGQPELDEHLSKRQLRQLEQRITFSYYLPLLTRTELETYLIHRLALVGYTTGSLFAKKAKDMLFYASKGVPRIVNILCHKALLVAYGRGELVVNKKTMQMAITDTQTALNRNNKKIVQFSLIISILTLLIFIFMIFYLKRDI